MNAEQVERILALWGALTTLAGVVATFLPQSWRATKLLTKLGSLSLRAKTNHDDKPSNS